MRSTQRFAKAVVSLCTGLVIAANPSAAIILDSGGGRGNTEPPADDPGWANVAQRGFWSAVYLADRWLLTARHVGAGDVFLRRERFKWVVGSEVVLRNDDSSFSDLLMFRIDRTPELAPIRISPKSPADGTPIVMIGQGRSRGERFRWSGRTGFRWDATTSMRWGTNTVAAHIAHLQIRNSATFSARFSYAGSRHEALATAGDSGGAAFVRGPESWELAGIMLAVDSYIGQPRKSGAYGNVTYMADLAQYRDQIGKVMRGEIGPEPAHDPSASTDTK